MNLISKQILSGVFYIAVSQYTQIFISLIVTAILSRILTPSDFGVVAIATIFIHFFSIFCDMGFRPALIQNKSLNSSDISNIFSFTLGFGLIIGFLFFLIAPFVATLYKNDIFINICHILSLNLVFATFNIVPNALLLKSKKFRFISVRNLTVNLIIGIIAVISALKGGGIYSLLIAPVGTSLLIFIINYNQFWIPIKNPFSSSSINSIRKILSFAVYQFIFDVINYFSRNLDKLLIGRYMNLSDLGYYEKSYRFMMLPISNISHVVTPVIQPVFSEYQNDYGKLSNYNLALIRKLAIIGFPLSVFLFFNAQELILLVFGNQWINSIPVFKIFSLSVGFQIITASSGAIYQSAGNTKVLMIVGIINTSVFLTLMFIGLFFFQKIEMVAWTIVLGFILNFLITYNVMYRIVFRFPFWNVLMQLKSALLLSMLLSVILLLFHLFVHIPNDMISMALKILVCAVVYLSYISITKEISLKLLFKK